MPLAPVKNRARSRQSKRERWLKTLRTLTVIFVIIAVVVGGIYFLIAWLNKPKVAGTTPTATETQQIPSILTPHKPPRDMAIGSSIQTLTSPVAPGGNVSLTLRTTESAICAIKVIRLDDQMREVGRVTDGGLADKKADDFGVVTWTWTMPSDAAIATWHADILCTRDTKTTRSVGDIVVQKAKT